VSTYTCIHHNQLKQAIHDCIHQAFAEEFRTHQRTRISIYSKNAAFVQKPHNKTPSVSQEDLVRMVNFLIDNAYVACGHKLFRQIIGIPMGLSCSPRLANLFLHFREYNWITNMINSNKKDILHQHFNACFRYLDDLFTGNNDNKINTYKQEIYGNMELIQQNTSPHKADWLNLQITTVDGQYRTSLYDKRKTFDFKPVQFTHITSNTPNTSKYSIIIGQMVTYARACGKYKDFVDCTIRDIKTMQNECNLDTALIHKKIQKFTTTHQHEYNKYFIPANILIKDIIQKTHKPTTH
jgi:hypothetical protein